MLIFVLSLLLLAGLVNFYCSLQILKTISTGSPEEQMNFWELRWQVHKFMKRYRALTRQGSPRDRFIWYLYWISLALMILSVVLLGLAGPAASA